MAVNVYLKSSILKQWQQKKNREFFASTNFVEGINHIVRTKILPLINAGRSPVDGEGRFEKYKNPDNYPGKGKTRLKPSRPVNLKLTGKMLSQYKAQSTERWAIAIGISQSADQFEKDKARWNNFGTKHIVPRPFIPQNRFGQEFTVSVMRAIKNAFTVRLKRLISK